jgi:prepilin-type N-terminal cleavage/methylation domain
MLSVTSLSRPRAALRRAFSLVEMLIVVVVIGILMAVVVPQFSKARTDTQDTKREADLRAVEKALEAYNIKYGVYPNTGGAWKGDAPSYGGLGYGADGYIPGLVPEFLPQLPRDPNPAYPTGGRGYLYRSNGTDYKFLAHQTPTVFPADHPLYDPARPNHAWQVSSFGGKNW